MKRAGLLISLFLAAGLIGWLLFGPSRKPVPSTEGGLPPDPPPASPPGITVVTTPSEPGSLPDGPVELIGEAMLHDYGDPTMSPMNDLKLMAGLMSNLSLLVKSIRDRPMSVNEDWAAALRGENQAHQRFLPDQHRAYNEAGQLVDRWGTPLFFHALGNRRFEIRSAGPDRKMWTDDDLHRNPDGSFRSPAELNRPGLYDPSPPGN